MSKNVEETKKVVDNEEEIKETEKDTTEERATKEPEASKDEPKKEEEKKEFFLISGFKAVGRGVRKVGDAWCGFAQKHPYVATGLAAGAGVAAKMGYDKIVDHFCGDDPAEPTTNAVEVPQLPEAEPIEIDYEPETELEMDNIELPSVNAEE
jgi:hypothetical protein